MAELLDKPTITPAKLVASPLIRLMLMLRVATAKGKVDVESANALAVGPLNDASQGGTWVGAEMTGEDVRKRPAVHVQRGVLPTRNEGGKRRGGLDERLNRSAGKTPSGSGARFALPTLLRGRPCAAALPSSSHVPRSFTAASVTFAPIDEDGAEEAALHRAYAGSLTAAKIVASPLRPAPSKQLTLTVALQPPAADRPTDANERFVETPALRGATFAERKVVPARDGAKEGSVGSA